MDKNPDIFMNRRVKQRANQSYLDINSALSPSSDGLQSEGDRNNAPHNHNTNNRNENDNDNSNINGYAHNSDWHVVGSNINRNSRKSKSGPHGHNYEHKYEARQQFNHNQ